MDRSIAYTAFQDKLLSLYEANESLFGNDTSCIVPIRKKAIVSFKKLGLPTSALEQWRSSDLSSVLDHDYNYLLKPSSKKINAEKIFKCEVTDLDTFVVTQMNGWVTFKKSPLTTFPNGVIVGSLAKALQDYPELIKKHFSKYADCSNDGLIALNTAFAQDGVFIYVPDEIIIDKPIQIINIINSSEDIFIQPRNLVIMGKNSRLTIVHCDHSLKHTVSFVNSISEVYLGENAELDHYKIQNKDNSAALITSNYFYQQANSRLSTNTITLHGGFVRNNLHVTLAGEGASANLFGLYLTDNIQHIDNNTFVDHVAANCTSKELYKGILDDQANGVFSGYIRVRKNAQKTNASQSNKNILLTDKAMMHTKPHLEIYADDVKCSHGATVGQLDSEAMFYMRSRGIDEDQARMLLMNAFASEIVNKISIDPLRERIDELVTKRLRGELSTCDRCILNCNKKTPVAFRIDMSKV